MGRDEGRQLSNRNVEPGASRRPTIKDVAREAGVSFKTVSRVMNRDDSVNAGMRAAVEAAMAALDYRPHRAARSPNISAKLSPGAPAPAARRASTSCSSC